VLALHAGLGFLGCERGEKGAAPSASVSASASAPAPGSPLGPPVSEPEPRQGMAWIPGGALVAGTPPNHLPRIASEEIPGEQLILKGFHIDVFPFPNEEGAIPLSNATHEEAAAHCEEQKKRLCTELEWERACKGPNNQTYEYGNRYSAERCGTGSAPKLRPSGLMVGCRSDFGVYDLHGGVFEWTASPWGRGSERPLIAVRGGNSTSGELVGRCANGVGRPADTRSGTFGFRCCSGPQNAAEVVLSVARGQKLQDVSVDKKLAAALVSSLPEEALKELNHAEDFQFRKMWLWHPIGNEELTVLSGCANVHRDPHCGVVVVRRTLEKPKVLVWAGSGYRLGTLHADRDAREVWLLGADYRGKFKRLIFYKWGRVGLGEKDRQVGVLPKEEKPKKKASQSAGKK
jgi:hypothetical protein